MLIKRILHSQIKSSQYFPLRITLLYLILGGLWILFSDRIIASYTFDPHTITNIQTYNGWFFILISAAFFFILIKRDFKLIEIAQKELIESEERFRSLFVNAPLGYLSVDADGRIIDVNKSACLTLGYDEAEIIGKKLQNFLCEEGIEKFNSVLSKTQSVGELHNTEFKIRRKNKCVSIVAIEGKVAYSSEGKFKQMHCILIDVTERNKIEADLRKLSSALVQSPAAMVIMNKDGVIEYVNPKFTQLSGYSFEETIGKSPEFLKPSSMSSEDHKKNWKKLNQGEDWFGEYYNIRKDGEGYWELSSISPIKNSENEITNFLVVIENITPRKITEKELIRAKEEAEDLSKLKSNLLGNISHELRTPLVGIIGFAEFLKETQLDADQSEMVQKIIKSSKRLTNTLNSILYLSEFAWRGNYLNIEKINLSKHTPFLLYPFIEEAKEREIEFSVNIKTNSAVALIDEKMFSIILNNLVDNALKFTKNGKIEVTIDLVKLEEIKYSSVTVCDTGIGIAEQDKEKIFQEFRQASEGVSRWYEGTGLGLTLAKKMVEAMNGTISLQSEIGKGSTFSVQFPAIEAEEKIDVPVNFIQTEKANQKRYMLLVEDNLINKEVTKQYLNSMYLIDHAKNGEVAIQLSRHKQYDIILMDINLGGGINGIETAREIRKLNGYENVPVVAVTGYTMAGDKEVLLSEGLTHYIAKPFEKHELFQLLSDIFQETK